MVSSDTLYPVVFKRYYEGVCFIVLLEILQADHSSVVLISSGIDPNSDGLARAKRLGVPITHEGIEGLLRMPEYRDIQVVFDATSAKAHVENNALLQKDGKKVIDLTPAAIGPFTIPPINGDTHVNEPNVNMVTCGGQATIPMVYAVKRATDRVVYGEIIASIASLSAGPGTRANIDEFTETTSKAIETLGGAERGKAIIILNPAEPPVIMRDTVIVLSQGGSQENIEASILDMARRFRLMCRLQVEAKGSVRGDWR